MSLTRECYITDYYYYFVTKSENHPLPINHHIAKKYNPSIVMTIVLSSYLNKMVKEKMRVLAIRITVRQYKDGWSGCPRFYDINSDGLHPWWRSLFIPSAIRIVVRLYKDGWSGYPRFYDINSGGLHPWWRSFISLSDVSKPFAMYVQESQSK